MKRGQVWISAVLYLLIAAVAVVLILDAGVPLLKEMKDKSAFTKTKETMLSLDEQIKEVASEGEGSQRVVPVEIKDGYFRIQDNMIEWEMESEAKLLEPRTKISYGNLVVSSNIDVDSYDYGDYYLLENEYLIVNISAMTNSSNSTSNLISSIFFKKTNVTVPGNFTFMIGGNQATASGILTTSLNPPGNNTNVDYASVVVSVDSTISYELVLTLESQADFLTSRIRNVVT
jgi:hypothetical protein